MSEIDAEHTGGAFALRDIDRGERARADAAREASQVCEFVFVGGQHVANDLRRLQQLRITHVLNCATNVLPNR
ncbi:MAG: hypothetical protein ACK4ZJ_18420, partial [Allorhizobium sp.]